MLTISYMFNRSEEKIGAPPKFLGDPFARVAVEHLHRHEHRKHVARLAEFLNAARHRRQIFFIRRIHFPARAVEIHRAVVARLVSARDGMSHPFRQRRAHRPPERD